MTVIWGLYGYSLAFGDPDRPALKPYIGDGDFLFMKDVARSWPEGATAPVEPMFGRRPAQFRGSRTCCSKACSSSSRRR